MPSPSQVDAAILEALDLEPETARMLDHGGSGFSRTFKVLGFVRGGGGDEKGEGKEKEFFVKIGRGKGEWEVMFAGEHQSLNAIHTAVPSLCPKSYAHGALKSGGHFLATDFLDLSRPTSSTSSTSNAQSTNLSLAQKLARLHTTPAPTPPSHSTPQFGFPTPTCCGNTQQDNTFQATWADFYAHNRLLYILTSIEKNRGPDPDLRTLVQKIATTVVPRLLRNGHLKSAKDGGDILTVVVHGDLWSGNRGRGCIGGGCVEEVVFDPSCCWGHSEFEFGIMRMFGDFGGVFEREYFEERERLGMGGRDEPVGEWGDRVRLYELYHHLNHFSIFGGSYRGGAVGIMEGLIGKYGDFVEEAQEGS